MNEYAGVYNTTRMRNIRRNRSDIHGAVPQKTATGRRRAWTKKEIKTLKELWGGFTPAENIADTMGRTKNAVYTKACRLGLRRPIIDEIELQWRFNLDYNATKMIEDSLYSVQGKTSEEGK